MRTGRDRYLAAAEGCIQLARKMSDPARKLALIDLAQTWMHLAVQAEGDGHADIAYEPPPLSQSQSTQALN